MLNIFIAFFFFLTVLIHRSCCDTCEYIQNANKYINVVILLMLYYEQ